MKLGTGHNERKEKNLVLRRSRKSVRAKQTFSGTNDLELARTQKSKEMKKPKIEKIWENARESTKSHTGGVSGGSPEEVGGGGKLPKRERVWWFRRQGVQGGKPLHARTLKKKKKGQAPKGKRGLKEVRGGVKPW